MSEICNPHDKFFKEAFGREETARDFVVNYLPDEIRELLDLECIEAGKESFVDEELKEHFSDVIYRTRLKGGEPVCIYVLFEHKSYSDDIVLFQLLRYMVKIWHSDINNNKPLCPILPIVVYHGKEKWSVGVNFQSLMKVPEAMRPFVPEFSCLLYDLGKYTDEEIKGAVILKVAILLMKHIFSKDLGEKLPEILGLLVEIMDKQTGLEYLQTILRYLSSAGEHLNKEEVREALTKTFVEQGGNLMATLAEQWIEEGRAEGKKEGRAEAQKMLIELLEFRFSFAPSYMVEMVEGIMSLEVLRQLRKRAFTVDSLEQFEAILRERVSC